MTQQQKSPTTTNGHDGNSHENKRTSSLNADDPDEPEEDEILEESPCKRWSKRREKVKQRDVPGIDAAYLAMDNETGNEVVWNEVLFSERKNFREQEEKIRAVFDHLTRLEHPNLVKFHKYWMDTISDKPRIIFITEYMSSGSMSRFLQRARSSGSFLNIKAWKNWTRQILSALSYLHSCDPPIVHANLTCNTVFIQQNGLVKIGCVAPNTIHHHVKTFRENIKNIHYLAPEYDHLTEATTQADIYSFGVCALEMATTGALQNGSIGTGANTSGTVACTSEKSGTNPPENVATTTSVPSGGGGFHVVTEEFLRKAVNSLEDNEQKELIERCLEHDPEKRANVAELLNRLGSPEPERNDEASLDEDGFNENEQQQQQSTTTTTHEPTPTTAIAAPVADRIASPVHELAPNTETGATAATAVPHQHTTGNAGNASSHAIEQHQSSQTTTQDRYHSTATTTHTATITSSSSATATTTTAPSQPVPAALDSSTATTPHVSLLQTPSQIASSTVVQQATAPDEGYHTTQSIVDAPTGTNTPLSTELTTAAAPGAPQHRETRQIVQMHAEMLDGRQLRVQLQLDDQMNRQLTGQLRDEDTPEALVAELIQHGFVSEANSAKMHDLLVTVISEHRRRELEQAARREFGDSTHQNPPPQYSVPTGSTASSCSPGNSSSANQSPKHQSASVPPNS